MSGIEPIAAISVGLNMARSFAQQQALQRAARAQARELEANAARAREQAAADADELRRRNRQLLGSQRALFAKSGVRLEGTPLLVQSDTAAQGEMDALSRLRQGDYASETLLGRASRARSAAPAFPRFF